MEEEAMQQIMFAFPRRVTWSAAPSSVSAPYKW